MSTTRRLPLDAWLAMDPGAGHLRDVDTVLRTMASSHGLARGLVGACVGTAGVLLAGTVLAAVTAARPAAPWLALAAVVLVACGLVAGRARAVRGVPPASLAAYRGAGTVRSGLGAALTIGAVLSAVLLPITLPLFEAGAADAAAAVALHALVLAQACCVFAVPAWFVQHSRRDFRAAVLTDPHLYAALDQLARTWDEPSGRREFGPL